MHSLSALCNTSVQTAESRAQWLDQRLAILLVGGLGPERLGG